MCRKSFDSVDEMRYHFDYEEHEFIEQEAVAQMSRVADEWVKRYTVEKAKSSSSASANDSTVSNDGECNLLMGWAIPKRSTRRLSNIQKTFLNKLFDEGEKSGSKVTAEHALKLMKEEFDPVNFLPLSSIKSYFSRRKKAIHDGKSQIGEILPVIEVAATKTQFEQEETEESEKEEVDDTNIDEDNDEGDNGDENEEQRSKAVSRILALAENVPDLQPDDWIAVKMGATWYPGQFIQFDSVLEELEVNFLQRSSSNERWFVWPSLNTLHEDKSWVEEKHVFYRLTEPKKSRRKTLVFDEYNEVEKAFKEL